MRWEGRKREGTFPQGGLPTRERGPSEADFKEPARHSGEDAQRKVPTMPIFSVEGGERNQTPLPSSRYAG